jgi:hypothetical protein
MSVTKVQIPLPANSTIRLTGITNSGSWAQQIAFQTPDGKPVSWTGNGNQNNKVIGQLVIGPYSTSGQMLTVTMAYNAGSGFQPSQIKTDSFNLDGLSGYIVGGQDGGGRPSGDAYWNTILFVYWAYGY